MRFRFSRFGSTRSWTRLSRWDGAQIQALFGSFSSVRQGTEGRNDIPGFGLAQIDLSVGRRFPISERVNLLFRADAFNIFQSPKLHQPNCKCRYRPTYLSAQHMLNQGLGGLNPLFQEGGPQLLQVSLKLSF